MKCARDWRIVIVTGRKTTKHDIVEVGDVRECAVGNFKIIARPCCRVVLRFDCTKHAETAGQKPKPRYL